MMQEKEASATAQKWAEQFAKTDVCPDCKGARLNKEALHFRIHDKNIYELATMDISELYDWVCHVEDFLEDKQRLDSNGNPERNTYPTEIPAGCGTGLSVVEPFISHTFGRRKPAYSSGHADWFSAGECCIFWMNPVSDCISVTISG